MASATEHNIAEKRGEQIAESNFGIVAKNLDKLRGKVIEFDAAAVFVNKQPLKLVYFGVILVHF